MRRVLKCDGVVLEKRRTAGQEATLTPADVREVQSFVQARRTLTSPFDIVVQGKSDHLAPQRQEMLLEWQAAGATWWVEDLIGLSETEAVARLQSGSPQLT